MGTVVYKYELNPGITHIDMPLNAKVLSAHCQRQGVYIWAEVRPKNTTEVRTFEVYGTGHEIPEVDGERIFIGTALMSDAMFIWHVFERQGRVIA